MNVRLENLAQFMDGIEAWIEETEELAHAVFKGLISQTFDYVLQGTPEWSGNLAANWRVGIGAPSTDYDDIFKDGLDRSPTPGGRDPYSRQDPNTSALHYARVNAREVLAAVTLASDVYISNSTPYAYEVEVNEHNGKPFIRAVNLPIEMIHAANEKFGVGTDLGAADALTIAGFRL